MTCNELGALADARGALYHHIAGHSKFWRQKVSVITEAILDYEHFFFFFLFSFFLSFVFLGPHLWHMEVPRLGVELEL